VTYRGQTGGVRRYDLTRYLTHLNPRIDCVSCVSEAVRQDLLANGVPDRKLVTIYKGHDIAWYEGIEAEELSELGVPPEAFVVACVANNRPRKGVPVLIESADYLPENSHIHFLLIGIGMTSDAIRDQVSKSPLANNFHLLDYTTDVLKLVAACDATILPATRGEGLPKTVIESMGLGITPIATSTGGSPELIVDAQSGLVVPPNDAPALARAVSKIAADPELNRRLAREARKRLATHFTLERTVADHRRLYESLVSRGGP
jgi:glycosyltransferase involved in cell wall biosynthesis